MRTYRNYFGYLLLLLASIIGCKKEDTDGAGGGNNTGAVLTPPSCLPTKINNPEIGEILFTYDNSKRIIKESRQHDSSISTYIYSGNVMLEISNDINTDGSINIDTNTHYLNSSGFIEKTVSGDPASSYLREVFYTYNAFGYLVREITKNTNGSFVYYSYGLAYSYENGNRTKSWDLNLNSQTGEATDSSIIQTATYTDLPGKISHIDSWIDRLGMPNKNDPKSMSYGTETVQFAYTIGTNGYPSKMTQTNLKGQKMEFDLYWICN